MTLTQRSELSPISSGYRWKPETTVLLAYGYEGGQLIDNAGAVQTTAGATIALTDNATNYVEVSTGGVVSKNTSSFTPGKYPMARVITASGEITTVQDMRHEERPLQATIIPTAAPAALVAGTYTISVAYSQAEVTALRDAVVACINLHRTALIAAGVEL